MRPSATFNAIIDAMGSAVPQQRLRDEVRDEVVLV
jgi:hypothetical protein